MAHYESSRSIDYKNDSDIPPLMLTQANRYIRDFARNVSDCLQLIVSPKAQPCRDAVGRRDEVGSERVNKLL
jgi:hypothetical protein